MKACRILPLYPHCSLVWSLLLLLSLLPAPSSQVRLHSHRRTLSLSDEHKKSWLGYSPSHYGITPFNKGLILRRKLGERDEEKTQMGSRPPSCDSKCNNCKPCKAVQVPTTPQAKLPVSPGEDKSVQNHKKNKQGNLRASAQLNSNYKPEGWKCTCGNKFYNP